MFGRVWMDGCIWERVALGLIGSWLGGVRREIVTGGEVGNRVFWGVEIGADWLDWLD